MSREDDVDQREIFSSDSSEEETHGGYEVNTVDGSVSLDSGEYFLDKSGGPATYRPPTPPCP